MENSMKGSQKIKNINTVESIIPILDIFLRKWKHKFKEIPTPLCLLQYYLP